MQEPTVPDEVRLLAATSRLLDLHQSRRDQGGVYVPEPSDRSALNLTLGWSVLSCLSDIESVRGEGFVPIPELQKAVSARFPGASHDDVTFAMTSLASSRELRWAQPNGEGGFNVAHTRSTTPAVELADGFAQVRLTDNGRLLLRLRALRDRWLYQDIDATKLAKAIEYGRFDHVVELCEEMTRELAKKSRTLTQMMERPSLVELRESLIRDGAVIAQTLRSAKQAVMDASERLYQESTYAEFEAFRNISGVDYRIENLQTELDTVIQTVESFSRRFIDFLQTAQKVRNAGSERIRFLDLADHLVLAGTPMDRTYLEAAFENILPIGVQGNLFHPEFLCGVVDFAELLGADNPDAAPTVIERDLEAESPHQRMQSFVLRHRTYLVERLRKGPIRFSDLLRDHGLALKKGESAIDFFGAYVAPDHFSGEGDHLVLGLTDTETEFLIDGKRYVANDPILVLRKGS